MDIERFLSSISPSIGGKEGFIMLYLNPLLRVSMRINPSSSILKRLYGLLRISELLVFLKKIQPI